ncbi:hypothetical protein A5787_14250 [Mycobacterium sp. 852002-50816_SCH5313054-b]|uniref:hypothetical protein n=1 Tax=Mycobacterium sp. 852002-50816_SCH5313054-b TaxID=1834092 RepID=UPI0007FCEB85|nr:hypothetical protein [Mycobacterium sp. 852002-50816_SCH5313054-b]OBF43911.1 hypothetical protein A5787_14250 [Mycobacterium sp. 852002-50816_SCH5313054-b]
MTVDVRLLNAIDAAGVLDDPRLTLGHADQVMQYCSILVQSVDAERPFGSVNDEGFPTDELRVAFKLLTATSTMASALQWPSDTEWWIDYRKRALADFSAARREAELCANGSISASTLTAVAAAERRADEGTAVLADDMKPPALVTRSDMPTAFSPEDAGPVAWSF